MRRDRGNVVLTVIAATALAGAGLVAVATVGHRGVQHSCAQAGADAVALALVGRAPIAAGALAAADGARVESVRWSGPDDVTVVVSCGEGRATAAASVHADAP